MCMSISNKSVGVNKNQKFWPEKCSVIIREKASNAFMTCNIQEVIKDIVLVDCLVVL